MQIIKDHIPGFPRVPYAMGRPTMIVLHETANPTATIDNEVAYVKRNWQNANFHYIVDANKAVEVTDPDYMGGGAGPNANPYAIHIELVRNTDFAKAYNNWLDLAGSLAKRYGIPMTYGQANGITTHNWVSQNMGGTDHTDPDAWLATNGVSINKLAEDINKRGGNLMIPDLNHLDVVFQRFFRRNSTQEEQERWIGKGTYTELIDVLITQPAYFAAVKSNEVGEKALRDDWEGQINRLTVEVTDLKAASEYEQVNKPVYIKKA